MSTMSQVLAFAWTRALMSEFAPMVSSLTEIPSSLAIGCQTLVRSRSCVVPPQETMVTVLSSAACADENKAIVQDASARDASVLIDKYMRFSASVSAEDFGDGQAGC